MAAAIILFSTVNTNYLNNKKEVNLCVIQIEFQTDLGRNQSLQH